jgi:hypothetical protein
MSIKNSNDTIRNRSRDLGFFSPVPQPLRHRVPSLHPITALNSQVNICSLWTYILKTFWEISTKHVFVPVALEGESSFEAVATYLVAQCDTAE